MRSFSWVLLLSCCFKIVSAQSTYNQLEYTNWFVGTSILHFDLINDTITYTDFTLANTNRIVESSFECRATASNNKGELLFFSTGSTIYTANADTMKGGGNALLTGNENGATGGRSSTMQGLLFVKHPLNDSLYYAFTGDDALSAGKGLNYNIIDLRKNGGKGEVFPAVNVYPEKTTEALSACLHANGKDIWIVSQKVNSDSTYSVLLTENGVDLNTLVASNIGFSFSGNLERGAFRFNSKGDKLFHLHFPQYLSGGLMLHDFNISTGKVSRTRSLTNDIVIGENDTLRDNLRFSFMQMELSANEKYLYIRGNGLIRVDISDWNDSLKIQKSIKNIYKFSIPKFNNNEASLMKGPDRHFYLESSGQLIQLKADWNAAQPNVVMSSLPWKGNYSGGYGINNMFFPKQDFTLSVNKPKPTAKTIWYANNQLFSSAPIQEIQLYTFDGKLVDMIKFPRFPFDLSNYKSLSLIVVTLNSKGERQTLKVIK